MDLFDTDILIIGGGGAAAIAALYASEGGAKVTILSKTGFIGGATVQASSAFALNIEPADSPETFFKDVMRSGEGINNQRLVKVLTENARGDFLELEKWLVRLDRSETSEVRSIKKTEGHAFMRSYADRRQMHGILLGLSMAANLLEIRILENRFVTKIIRDRDVVAGVSAFNSKTGDLELFRAKVVILATGGCGQIYRYTTNSLELTGDGYAYAFDLGLPLIDMEMVQFLPLAFPYPESYRGTILGMASLFGKKVRFYNGAGKRFMKIYDPVNMEYTTRDIAARAIYNEIKQGRGTPEGAIIVDPTESERSELEKYRSSSKLIYDILAQIFGEEAARWEKPFLAVPSAHFVMGGIKIDERGHTQLRNLLAMGEVAGGVQGANRLGGAALTEMVVFGKAVGQEATRMIKAAERALALERELEAAFESEKQRIMQLYRPRDSRSVRPYRVKEEIQDIMWEKVSIIKKQAELEEAWRALKQIEDDDLQRMRVFSQGKIMNRELIDALEAENMLKVAKLVVKASTFREESRGAHFRDDYPNKNDEEWLRNVVVQKAEDGSIGCYAAPLETL
jgi:fumarate reductase (CoM/CoB) subunit A